MSSTTAMLRGIWATITNDRVTPARNAISVFASVANRAVFPLSMDCSDTSTAVEFFSDNKNIDAVMNSIFGPLCGMNSDSTYGFLPWILLADEDEKLRDAILNLLGPDSSLGKICSELSTPSPDFYQNLRRNWGDEYSAVLMQSENETEGGGDAGGSKADEQLFITQPIPLSMICYFSTRVLHETTATNLRLKSRLDIPPVMLLPMWTPPIVTQKYSSTMSTDASGAAAGTTTADLTVSSLRVSMLTYLLFRMIRCLVAFGQVRDKQSYVASWFGRKLGPLTRRTISKLPPAAANVARGAIHYISTSRADKEHRFSTLEALILNWSQHLLSASIARSMLHRERMLALLVSGATASDDNKLLNLCDPSEWHSSVLTLLLPSMCHIYGTPMNGEASRNPLSDQRHIDLIECTLPVLTKFLDQISSNLGSIFTNTNNDQTTSGKLNQSFMNGGISGSANQATAGDPQVKAAIEKTPRLIVHDLSVPARAALRTCAGVARQTMMTLFVTKRESVEDSESLLFDRVCELWVSIVRCSRALARFTEQNTPCVLVNSASSGNGNINNNNNNSSNALNNFNNPMVGLRQYESTCALLGDFVDLCLRAEAEWGSKNSFFQNINNNNNGKTDGASSNNHLLAAATEEFLNNNSNSSMMKLSTIENFTLILSWLVDQSSNQQQQQQHRQPYAFVKEISTALEQLQLSGGNVMMLNNNNNNNKKNSNNNADILAIADSFDASINVNALFDFQGEAPVGEAVPSWKCYMALLGRSSRASMGRLYQVLKRTLDQYSAMIDHAATSQSHNNNNNHENSGNGGSALNEINARISGVRKQLENTFIALYGDDFIFNINAAGNNNNYMMNGDDAVENDDFFSPAMARRFRNENNETNESGENNNDNNNNLDDSSRSGGFKNKRGAKNIRFTYDPRVSILSRKTAKKFNGGKLGVSELSSGTTSSSTSAPSEDLRYHIGGSTSIQQNQRQYSCQFIPNIDEIHFAARYLHKVDVALSTVVFFLLTLLKKFVFPVFAKVILLFATLVLGSKASSRPAIKGVLDTLTISANNNSTASSSSSSSPSGTVSSSPACKVLVCSYCRSALSLATDSFCCHVHHSEIGVWHCTHCDIAYCAPTCRNVVPTTNVFVVADGTNGNAAPSTSANLPIVPATNRVKEVTCCAKCLVKLAPSDTQYWVAASRSILCPGCCAASLNDGFNTSIGGRNSYRHIKLFRFLASNYFVVAVIAYYVLSFLYWLFLAEDSNASGNNSGSYNTYLYGQNMFMDGVQYFEGDGEYYSKIRNGYSGEYGADLYQ